MVELECRKRREESLVWRVNQSISGAVARVD